MSLIGSVKSSLTKASTSARVINFILNKQSRHISTNVNKSRVLLSPITYNNVALLNMTSVRQVQTAGDTEISSFLNDEIASEVKQEKNVPEVRGFKLAKQEGANVTLERTSNDEVVSVTLNVNNSVADEPSFEEQQNDKDVEMVSRPPFLVEIRKKSGGQTLAIQCIFPTPETTDQPQDQQYDDAIEIQDVTFLGKDQEWGDFDYSVQGSIMDGNLYAMMLTMLEERGIDGNFVEDLVDFSTTYEHKQYVSFLKSLKTFVSK